MPLLANDEDRYPGAAVVARLPFSAADCTNFPSIEELAVAQGVAGTPYAIVSGELFIDDALVDIETACEAV